MSLDNPATDFPLVIAMYTKDYLDKAQRLEASLIDLGLSHAICEVGSIHSSTSVRGDPSSRHKKPRFIQTWLQQTGRPILFVDADTVFKSNPELILEISRVGCQFSIFNWLSGEENQTVIRKAGRVDQAPDYYGFAIPYVSADQIIVSGAVQFWGNSAVALELLESWEATIDANPRARDDHCLDFAFNNFPDADRLGFRSLPRSYCRYAWWPEVNPVIDHPETPSVNAPWKPLSPEYSSKRVHTNRLSQKPER